MGIFCKKVMIFLFPLILVFSIMYGRYIYAGLSTLELLPFDFAIAVQEVRNNSLLGMGYNEETQYYKLTRAHWKKTPVISLGTSRVMQFSSRYFEKDAFYNCGGIARYNFDEYLNAIKNLDYMPEVVILGIDFWLFNEAFIGTCPEFPSYTEITISGRAFNDILKQIKKDYDNGKWSYDDILNYPGEIGFNGRIKQNGFQRDGMYFYGDIYRHPEQATDYQFKDTLERIETGTRRFEYGDEIYEKTIKDLEGLIKYCKEQGITVVGFLAPVAPTIIDTMMASGNYRYIEQIPGVCSRIFDKYEYTFIDLLDMQEYGFGDESYIDGFHGSQVVYAVIAKILSEKNERLASFINLTELSNLIDNRFNNMLFDPI